MKKLGPIRTLEASTKTVRWTLPNGDLHREDGPAIEHSDGSEEWYINGQPHRIDGPAYEWEDGHKEWWQNGQPHREDGPAIIYQDGTEYWCIHGRELDPLEIFLLQGKQKG